ncbi:MAG TPA: hypothetical protein VNS55_10205 [Nocardioides sp.]|nr:hypothetical protein [Nocardioides sp.]
MNGVIAVGVVDAHRSRAGASGAARPALGRLVFLAPAAVSLLVGLDAALVLLGVPAPVSTARLPDVHGMLLVFGFVGTLISLERAVALRVRQGYAAPGLLGAGGLLLVSPLPLAVGQWTLLAGAVALVGVYVPLWRRQQDDAVLVQAFGAVLAVGALALWARGVPVAHLLPWLAGFVVLTIAGERLELARLAMGPGGGTRLLLLSTGLVGGVVATLLWPDVGYPLLGLVLLGLVGWLAVHDVARRTVRTSGLTRFMAASMLAGYVWLAVAGATWAVGGSAYDGPAYDVVIHAVFLGFTISMIMAHAPVILPAVLRRPLPYHPALLVPAALLQLSLVVRLWVGDGRGIEAARETGGVLNVVALLGFVGVAAWSATRTARTEGRAS